MAPPSCFPTNYLSPSPAHGVPGSLFTWCAPLRAPSPTILAVPISAPRTRDKYASYVWNASILLADMVAAREIDVHGRKVLELGAGLGLPGLVAARMGADLEIQVVLTDYDHPASLADTARAATEALPPALHPLVHVLPHTWGTPIASLLRLAPSFDTLLLADCVWSPALHVPLVASLAALLRASPAATVHFAAGFHTGRAVVAAFLRRAAELGVVPRDKGQWRELADPDALKGSLSPHLAQNGVMIRADQSYEAALAEVREHYGLAEDAYACSFSQRQPERNRSVFIARSAWDFVEPNSDLELLVVPLVKTADSSSPALYPQGAPDASDGADPVPVTSRVVAPATPGNTDHSESEVSDSDEEGSAARAQRINEPAAAQVFSLHRQLVTTAAASAGPPRASTAAEVTIQAQERSATPSPSDRSCKAALHQHIEGAEQASEGSSSPRANSPNRHQDAPQRFLTLTPPTQTLDPAFLRYSVESHSSFRIGLDDAGEVAFVPRSPVPFKASLPAPAQAGPSRSAKGKERALSPEQDQDDASQDEERPVKPEPRSSQPGSSFAFARPPSSRVALKPPSSGFAKSSFSSNATSKDRSTVSTSVSDLASVSTSTSKASGSRTSSEPSPDSQGPPTLSKLRSPSRGSPAAASRRIKRPAPTAEETPRKRVELPRSAASPARSTVSSTGPSSKTGSSARFSARKTKTPAERRAEALARPRVQVPHERRSSRFHYYLRLPNWPVAPCNAGPLKDRMYFKQGARGDGTFGLTVQFVFEAAAKATGWKVDDLRLTFYSREADGVVDSESLWGWDKLLTSWRDLEEIGLESGDIVDIDHRSGLDDE
ncbi:hypothetical protein JCM3770_005881 [Rhodotorula araucariae]